MPVIRDNPGDFTEDDWLEAVDNYSPNQYTISRNRSYATLNGWVVEAKLKSAYTTEEGRYAHFDNPLRTGTSCGR